VEVTLSEEATRYVAEHGGTLYVRTHSHRCCQGPLTLVDVTTSPPRDLADYVAYDAGAVAVQFHGGEGQPSQLAIEMGGMRRRRLVAQWDGCAYRM
jgi:hypothetical protein